MSDKRLAQTCRSETTLNPRERQRWSPARTRTRRKTTSSEGARRGRSSKGAQRRAEEMGRQPQGKQNWSSILKQRNRKEPETNGLVIITVAWRLSKVSADVRRAGIDSHGLVPAWFLYTLTFFPNSYSISNIKGKSIEFAFVELCYGVKVLRCYGLGVDHSMERNEGAGFWEIREVWRVNN